MYYIQVPPYINMYVGPSVGQTLVLHSITRLSLRAQGTVPVVGAVSDPSHPWLICITFAALNLYISTKPKSGIFLHLDTWATPPIYALTADGKAAISDTVLMGFTLAAWSEGFSGMAARYQTLDVVPSVTVKSTWKANILH